MKRSQPDMATKSIVPEVIARYPKALYRSPAPSFLSGMARTLDLAGVLDPRDLGRGNRHDAQAIHADWDATGNDLRKALTNFGIN